MKDRIAGLDEEKEELTVFDEGGVFPISKTSFPQK